MTAGLEAVHIKVLKRVRYRNREREAAYTGLSLTAAVKLIESERIKPAHTSAAYLILTMKYKQLNNIIIKHVSK